MQCHSVTLYPNHPFLRHVLHFGKPSDAQLRFTVVHMQAGLVGMSDGGRIHVDQTHAGMIGHEVTPRLHHLR
jgi:hypothetical protein